MGDIIAFHKAILKYLKEKHVRVTAESAGYREFLITVRMGS